MANEIDRSNKTTVTKDGVAITTLTSTKKSTMQSTLGNMHHGTQIVGTSAEDIVSDDVDLTKEYGVQVWNRSGDDAVYVDVIIRKDVTPTDVTTFRIRNGECWDPGRCSAQTAGYPKIRLLASAASTKTEVLVWDAGDPAL